MKNKEYIISSKNLSIEDIKKNKPKFIIDYSTLHSDIKFFFENVSPGCENEVNKLLGIGFGKTIQHNFELIANLNKFTKFGFPIMIGPSRKSFIGKTLNLPIEDRIDGTSASVTAGIMNGARIVRVHDVKEIKRVVTIVDKIRTAK